MIDKRADGSGDAVAFIAHDDDTVGCQRVGVDIVSVEQGTVDRCRGWEGRKERHEVCVDDFHSRYATHSGLHHLRSKGIRGLATADDSGYAKPVGYAYYSAEVSWVLHTVEDET